jgi:hypothetical protein
MCLIDGQLRKLHEGQITDEKFEFNIKDDHEYNQKHYEALGEVKQCNYWQIVELQLLE